MMPATSRSRPAYDSPGAGALVNSGVNEESGWMKRQTPGTDDRAPSDSSAAPSGLSFGAVAEDYDRYRPELPEEVLDWLLPADCSAALDLGAGTGGATRVLLRRVPRVFAVEPDPRMRAFLAIRAPGAQVLEGWAEAIPTGDARVDAVVICSAWHWMEPEAAFLEIARVLRRGGVLGIIWNRLDQRVPWVAELRRLTGQPDPDGEAGGSRRPEDVVVPEGAPFGAPQLHTIPWTWERLPEEVVGLASTDSSVLALSPQRRAHALADAREFLGTLRLESAKGSISAPMACRCWKAVRT